jgi:glycosyltransferase involved in cell wall biosynthesis
VAALRQALSQAVSRPGHFAGMAERARKRVETEFDSAVRIQRMTAVYQRVQQRLGARNAV